LTQVVPQAVTAGILLVGAGAAAWFGSGELIESVMQWGVRILAPVIGVLLADYFFVRHSRYETDDLFRVGGEYPLVNIVGVLGWLAGLAFAEWLKPVVFEFLGWNGQTVDAPATLAALVVAALIYAVVGRFLVREHEYVADIRF